jgi:hypothetical protein
MAHLAYRKSSHSLDFLNFILPQSATRQRPNTFGIALAAPSVLAKGKELPSAIIGAASAKDACIIIFLLFE